jgi:hypothetical protein
MIQVLANVSLESFLKLQKGGMWLCKKKSIEKNGQVSNLKRKRKRIIYIYIYEKDSP